MDKALDAESSDYFAQLRMVGGHLKFDDERFRKIENYGPRVVRVAILRRPFDRVVSHFDFVNHTTGRHFLRTEGSFEEALQSKEPIFKRSKGEQNFYLSGRREFHGTVETLKSGIYLIGLFEQRDKLFERLGELFYELESGPTFPKANAGRKGYKPQYEKFRWDPRVRELINEDFKLYHWVREEHSGLFDSTQR